MTHRYCGICQHPLPDHPADAHACTPCTHQLRAWLEEIPTQLPYLRASLQRDVHPTQGQARPVGRAHAPLPVALPALNLLGPGTAHPGLVTGPATDQSGEVPVTALLHGWADYIASTYPAAWRDEHDTIRIDRCTAPTSRHGTGPAAWCAWLTAYLPYAATQPWIADLHRQVQDLVYAVRAVTRTDPRRRILPAPCPACGEFALVDVDWAGISCELCRHPLTAEEYAAHAAAVMPGLSRTAISILVAQQLAAARETPRPHPDLEAS